MAGAFVGQVGGQDQFAQVVKEAGDHDFGRDRIAGGFGQLPGGPGHGQGMEPEFVRRPDRGGSCSDRRFRPDRRPRARSSSS